MRTCVLFLLLLACYIAKGNGCSSFARKRNPDTWRKDSENRHIDKINSIVHDVMEKLEKYAFDVGTSDSRRCYEESKPKLMEVLRHGEREVKKCIESVDSRIIGDDCCYRVQNQVGEESTRVALTATRCIVVA